MTKSPRRRRLLRTLSGAGALALAGCSNDATDATTTGGDRRTSESDAVETSEADTRTTTDLGAYCGGIVPETTTAATGTVRQTVTVGPDGNLVFEPDDMQIRAGDTVRWEWDSDNHNIRVDERHSDDGWEGTPGGDDTTYDEGDTYEHTFETTGTYRYFCHPHSGVGMEARVEVGLPPMDCLVLGEHVRPRVDVGPDGRYVFEPGTERYPLVPKGTEVRFDWDSDNHSIVVDSKPPGSDWTGTDGETFDSGYVAAHTFTEPGRYEYHCTPHQNLGMEGEFLVVQRDRLDPAIET